MTSLESNQLIDKDRRGSRVLIRDAGGRFIVVLGGCPQSVTVHPVLSRCRHSPRSAKFPWSRRAGIGVECRHEAAEIASLDERTVSGARSGVRGRGSCQLEAPSVNVPPTRTQWDCSMYTEKEVLCRPATLGPQGRLSRANLALGGGVPSPAAVLSSSLPAKSPGNERVVTIVCPSGAGDQREADCGQGFLRRYAIGPLHDSSSIRKKQHGKHSPVLTMGVALQP